MTIQRETLRCEKCGEQVTLGRKDNGILAAECECDQVAVRVAEAIPLDWEVRADE